MHSQTSRVRRFLIGSAAVAAISVGVTAPASAQDLQADGIYTNQGNGTTTALVSIDGDQMTVRIEANGLSPSLVHAQHIHGEVGVQASCPGIDADADGDGIVSTVEGAGQYGTVKVSLTTEGDTSPDSALAIDRYPVAEADGTYVYERTFTVDPEVAANVSLWTVVVHGVDLDESGEYDGDARSSLTDELPLEATMPATCGALVTAQVTATPTGGVAAGAGGTAQGTNTGLAILLGLGGLTALGGASIVAFSRRRNV